MATPKTDVVQSIGRILRCSHDQPLIIDIVDQHQVFKNQWNKRLRYYKKQKYTILKCDGQNYNYSEQLIKKPKKKHPLLTGICY